MGERQHGARDWVALLCVIGECALLANLLSRGALWRSVSGRYAELLAARRRAAELRRESSYVLFDAYVATRDAAREGTRP